MPLATGPYHDCLILQNSQDFNDLPRENNLYVKNLPFEVDDEALKAMFQARAQALTDIPVRATLKVHPMVRRSSLHCGTLRNAQKFRRYTGCTALDTLPEHRVLKITSSSGS